MIKETLGKKILGLSSASQQVGRQCALMLRFKMNPKFKMVLSMYLTTKASEMVFIDQSVTGYYIHSQCYVIMLLMLRFSCVNSIKWLMICLV